jgi:phosphoglycolate phosphatase
MPAGWGYSELDLDVQKIKAIVFDKDGTLIDFEASWSTGMLAMLQAVAPDDRGAQQALATAAGFDMDTCTFAGGAVFVNGTTEDLIAVWQGVDPRLSAVDLLAKGEVAFSGLDPEPLCDLPALLSGLRDMGLVLGVVTNAAEAPTLVQLQKLKCLELFDMVIGCDSGYVPKPAGDTILGFCENLKLDASQVAMVGDSTHDLDAGRAARVGMNIGVLSGPAARSQIAHVADVILDDVTQLPALFSNPNLKSGV